jgi:hypothetical protein
MGIALRFDDLELERVCRLDDWKLALWLAFFEKYDPEINRELHADWRAGVIASAIYKGPLIKDWPSPQELFPDVRKIMKKSAPFDDAAFEEKCRQWSEGASRKRKKD